MQTYRVCFADTDAAGIVYHARYLEMAERSRNEALRHARAPPGTLLQQAKTSASGTALVVHRIEAKYHMPAFPDDLLVLHNEIGRVSAAQISWTTRIARNASLICSVEADLVSIDFLTGRPLFISSVVLDAIKLIERSGSSRKRNLEGNHGHP